MREYILIFAVVLFFSATLVAAERVVIIPMGGKHPNGTATQPDVLEGKTFSSDAGIDLDGSMTNNGAITIEPGISDQTIPQGYHDGSGAVKGDANLVSGNIKSGTTIFGIPGSIIGAAGTATTMHVARDQSFSNQNGTFIGSRGTFWGCSYRPGDNPGRWYLAHCISDCTDYWSICPTCFDCDVFCNALNTLFGGPPLIYGNVCLGSGGGY